MEVIVSKGLRVIIEHSGIFFDEDRIKSLGNYTVSKMYDEDKRSFQDLYIFRQSIPGIEEMIITETQIQITIKELDNENYIEVLRTLFDFMENEYCINNISCSYYTGYTSRTYAELEEYGIPDLLPDLSKEEDRIKVTREGKTEVWRYKTKKELVRCKASFFDMNDALLFRTLITVETKNQSKKLEGILGKIREGCKKVTLFPRYMEWSKTINKDRDWEKSSKEMGEMIDKITDKFYGISPRP